MKTLKNRRGLSPVVASIILIAVTVAVSIAVAAWMGALSFSFMGNGEQMQLGSPYGWVKLGTTVNLTASCSSGNAWTIVQVRVNNTVCAFQWWWSNTTQGTAYNTPAGPVASQQGVTLIITTAFNFYSGYSYTFVVVTAKNNEFQTTGMVP